MFRVLLAEVRTALAEDPNNFFQPVPPKGGRRTANTVQLMGFEEPEEDDTSDIPNAEPDGLRHKLRSARRGPDMSGAGLQK